ncbi:MAG: metal-dependent hydrolase [Nitrospirae bacterium]|nr:metal-dependent hydrolase [Nitrospirota bacterium]
MSRKLFLSLVLFCLLVYATAVCAADKTGITWLGHSTFKVTTGSGKVLLIDPWITNPANPKGKEQLAALDKVDLILLTHGHGDHVGNTVEIAKKTGATIVATADLGRAMVQFGGLPEKYYPKENMGNFGGQISLLNGEVRILFVSAVHSSALEGATDSKLPNLNAYGGNPGGFVIYVKNGPTIYHTGDTDVFGDMALINSSGKIDVMLACIGDKFTMGPKLAAKAVQLVNPQVVVPMHYGTFPALTGTAAALEKEIKALGLKTEMKSLAVGETLSR